MNITSADVRRAIGPALLVYAAAALPAEPASCPDYLLTNEKLTSILRSSVGGIGALVKSSSARVNAANASCYVEMRLESVLPNCVLTACSTAVVEQPRRIGIREFRIQGCDAVFDALGPSKRTVKTAYSDVTAEITQHCGSGDYRIVDAKPARAESAAADVVRVRLQSEK